MLSFQNLIGPQHLVRFQPDVGKSQYCLALLSKGAFPELQTLCFNRPVDCTLDELGAAFSAMSRLETLTMDCEDHRRRWEDVLPVDGSKARIWLLPSTGKTSYHRRRWSSQSIVNVSSRSTALNAAPSSSSVQSTGLLKQSACNSGNAPLDNSARQDRDNSPTSGGKVTMLGPIRFSK